MRSVAINGNALAQWRKWAPLAVLLALCILISLFNSNFLTLGNFIRLLNSASIPLILGMGATFIILMGSIDLSVEGIVALTAVIASLLVANDITPYTIGLLAVPIAVITGGAMGLLNGMLHVKLRTPSFMTTLGVGFAGVGIAMAVLGGDTVRISDQTFRFLSLGRIGGIPMAVWIAAASVAIAYVIQERTRLGRWLYAIGTDEMTARHAGIPIERTRIVIFTVAGLFYGLGGVLSAAQFGQGHALISQGRLFTTITAVVVGGTALSGGVGSVLNSVIGVLIVVVLANGLVLMGIEPYVQQGVQGLLIITAVALALDRSRLDVVK
ncbi:MAG: ABC transporter permease [Alphaproteobacteria bacterium]|nr:MAG: ABC transporter permease [Alphaproteobacteria bacterium]